MPPKKRPSAARRPKSKTPVFRVESSKIRRLLSGYFDLGSDRGEYKIVGEKFIGVKIGTMRAELVKMLHATGWGVVNVRPHPHLKDHEIVDIIHVDNSDE